MGGSSKKVKVLRLSALLHNGYTYSSEGLCAKGWVMVQVRVTLKQHEVVCGGVA